MALINAQNKAAPPSFLCIRALLAPTVIFTLIFIAAGRFDYWQGWIYTVLTFLAFGVTYFVLKDNRELMTERLKPGKGVKWWDKIYFALATPFGFLTIILAALDTGRFGWSKPVHWSSYLAGYILFITGHAVFLWAKRTNRFFLVLYGFKPNVVIRYAKLDFINISGIQVIPAQFYTELPHR